MTIVKILTTKTNINIDDKYERFRINSNMPDFQG